MLLNKCQERILYFLQKNEPKNIKKTKAKKPLG